MLLSQWPQRSSSIDLLAFPFLLYFVANNFKWILTSNQKYNSILWCAHIFNRKKNHNARPEKNVNETHMQTKIYTVHLNASKFFSLVFFFFNNGIKVHKWLELFDNKIIDTFFHIAKKNAMAEYIQIERWNMISKWRKIIQLTAIRARNRHWHVNTDFQMLISNFDSLQYICKY